MPSRNSSASNHSAGHLLQFESLEDPEDVWLRPLDLRLLSPTLGKKIWEISQSIFTVWAIGIGLYAIFFTDLQQRNYLAFLYICGTLCCELAVLLISGIALACLVVCVGDAGLAHAIAGVSIFHKFMLGLCYMTAMGVGVYILVRPDFVASGKWDPVIIYVVVEVLIGLGHIVSSFPNWIGACQFVTDSCVRKFKNVPIVQFFGAGSRAQYVEYTPLTEYLEFVQNMSDPTAHEPFNVEQAIQVAPPPPVVRNNAGEKVNMVVTEGD